MWITMHGNAADIGRRSWTLLVLATALALSAGACKNADKPGAKDTSKPSGSSIERVEPGGSRTGDIIKTKTVSVDNCGGGGPISEALGAEETISVSIEKIDGQKISIGGGVTLEGFGSLNIGGEIARQYGLTYGQHTTVSDSRSVTVDAGKNVLYTVESRAHFDTGTVVVTDGHRTERFPYEILTKIDVVAKGTDQGCSFLGSLQGTWSLTAWRERPGDPTLGMSVRSGTLVIDSFGKASWELTLNSGGPSTGPTPGLRCLGEVDEHAKLMSGVTTRLVVAGEELTTDERDWGGNLLSLRYDALVAWCGWTFADRSYVHIYATLRSDYQLTLLTAGDQDRSRLLTMKNKAGTFTWTRAR